MCPNYLARGYQGLHVKQANKTKNRKLCTNNIVIDIQYFICLATQCKTYVCLIKRLCLCLRELWHSVINSTHGVDNMLITKCHNSHKQLESKRLISTLFTVKTSVSTKNCIGSSLFMIPTYGINMVEKQGSRQKSNQKQTHIFKITRRCISPNSQADICICPKLQADVYVPNYKHMYMSHTTSRRICLKLQADVYVLNYKQTYMS